MDLTQRHLVNRRLRVAGGEIVTKYVFPFWDGEWRLAFFIVDRLGQRPAILLPPIHEDKDQRLASSANEVDVRELASVDTSAFRHLYHYDPWWVFRGMGGGVDAWTQAIVPSNIAKTFPLEGRRWKVHDVEIASDGARVRAIVAKDEAFRRREFTAADLDLAQTWPKG